MTDIFLAGGGRVRETPHPPARVLQEKLPTRQTTRQILARGVKRDPLSAERTHRFRHGACKRNPLPTLDEGVTLTLTSTGHVRVTPLPTNDKTDSNTGFVREAPHPLNDETDCSTGRVRATLVPTNDEINARTRRVK